MIPLPPNIQVDRDQEAEAGLLARAKDWLARDSGARVGIHASDLLNPRQGFWKQVDPQPMSDREIGLFLVGKVLHAFVLAQDEGKASSVNLLVTDEGSTYSEELGLYYSPDKKYGDKVVEFKTSRGQKEPTELRDIEVYLKQLVIYMAAENLQNGEIWVLYVNAKDASGKTTPAFRVFKVTLTDDELTALKLEIRKQRDALADALVSKKHDQLPLCVAWLCHPEQCPWWAKCKPVGRYESMEYLRGKRK